jgi:hypothetical protein
MIHPYIEFTPDEKAEFETEYAQYCDSQDDHWPSEEQLIDDEVDSGADELYSVIYRD